MGVATGVRTDRIDLHTKNILAQRVSKERQNDFNFVFDVFVVALGVRFSVFSLDNRLFGGRCVFVIFPLYPPTTILPAGKRRLPVYLSPYNGDVSVTRLPHHLPRLILPTNDVCVYYLVTASMLSCFQASSTCQRL